MALDKLAARGEARGGAAIYELGFRMAVLVGAPPLEGSDLPVGPLALAKALRAAASAIELPVEHDLLLLQCLENALLPDLPKLYGALNDSLQAEGILPQLRPYPLATPPQRSRAPWHAAGEHCGRQPRPTWPAGGPSGANRNEPIAVLDSLRELLARRRGGQTVIGGEAGRRGHARGTADRAVGAAAAPDPGHRPGQPRAAQRTVAARGIAHPAQCRQAGRAPRAPASAPNRATPWSWWPCCSSSCRASCSRARRPMPCSAACNCRCCAWR